MQISVVVVKYFPVKGAKIDIAVTGDWGAPLAQTRKATDQMTGEIISALQEGSRYHGYKNHDAKPSLAYKVVKSYEFLEPLPIVGTREAGKTPPVVDYAAIMKRIDIQDWVENKGVTEVWLWGYHGGVVTLWESNMAGPHGDISNSNRDANDLPVLKHTYTVYHYNYQRDTACAVHDHLHQIEAVLNHADGRDETPEDKWGDLLFWGKFVGSDKTMKIVRPGCGWTHYPPNAERDYDWANKRVVMSDIEDWKPDGSGKKQPISSTKWRGDHLWWLVYWMQNLPGAKSGLTYDGRELNNWWIFIGDFDKSMDNQETLVKKKD